MPFAELVVYLMSIGDRIPFDTRWDERVGAKLVTGCGTRYVCSQNGHTFDGQTWAPKFLWTRV